MKNKNKIK